MTIAGRLWDFQKNHWQQVGTPSWWPVAEQLKMASNRYGVRQYLCFYTDFRSKCNTIFPMFVSKKNPFEVYLMLWGSIWRSLRSNNVNFGKLVIGSSWKYSKGKRVAFMLSAKTPPKVNRFGWNLGLDLAAFELYLRSSNSLRGSRNCFLSDK